MKYRASLTILLVTAALVATSLVPAGADLPAAIEPSLQNIISTAGPSDRVTAAVVFDQALSASDLLAIDATGVTSTRFAQLNMAAVEGTPAQITALSLVGVVGSMWENRPLDLTLEQSVAYIQADDVHAAPYGFSGRGIGVAVIDSGINGLHDGVRYPTKTVQNVKIPGVQRSVLDIAVPIEGVPDTDNTSGHGSHVAGIIAGTGASPAGQTPYVGVAPGANLIGLGAAEGVEVLTALAAYDWILSNRNRYNIRVINNSWADGKVAYDPNHPLNVASLKAHDAGITVVFAAGNDGQASGDVFNRYAMPDWVISVGGGDKLGRIGTYSSRGTEAEHADVVAPGSFIASVLSPGAGTANSVPIDATDPASPRVMPLAYQPYYTYKLGTSMAAPHVAGMVALLLQANPALTPDQIRSIIVSTATPMPGCPVVDCGAGYVNALAALQAALAARNRAPVASLVASPSYGIAPLTVTLDASGSTDADGTVISYRWDFDGDGTVDSETSASSVSRTYQRGSHTAGVTVVDDRGLASTSATVSIRASDPPYASATVPKHAKAQTTVTFDASGSSDPDGYIAGYAWDLDGNGTTDAQGSVVTFSYPSTRPPTVYAWRLTVTDDAGISVSLSGNIKVTPNR